VVLIRSPADAIVSGIALAKEVQITERGVESPRQRVSFAAWVHAWLSFYRALKPYRDRDQLLVAPFSAVIQDMGRVIERINAHFGTDFVPFNHTEGVVAAVHEKEGYHAGPSDRRAQLKKQIRSDFDDALRMSDRLQKRLSTADQLFDQYVKGASLSAS
jgi:hypothetical protein